MPQIRSKQPSWLPSSIGQDYGRERHLVAAWVVLMLPTMDAHASTGDGVGSFVRQAVRLCVGSPFFWSLKVIIIVEFYFKSCRIDSSIGKVRPGRAASMTPRPALSFVNSCT
jgi:hypothetical protein